MKALLILLPLIGLLIANLLPKRIGRVFAFLAIVIIGLFQITLVTCPGSLSGVDPLTLTFLMLIALVVVLTSISSIAFPKTDSQKVNFNSLLLIILMGMNGLVMVRDIFSMYVFIAIVAIASFVLIVFNRERDSFEGAYKYLVFSSVATVMLLTGIALIFLFSGSTSFESIKMALNSSPKNPIILLAMALYMVGLFIKGGLVPFHGWLADAYSAAPADVSPLLAGIVTKTVGIYPLFRVVSLYSVTGPIRTIILLVGIISIFFGALAALYQKDFKRMLAYSSISQMGYIVLGFGCGTPLGYAAAIFHLFNHTIFKSTLFFNAAAVEKQTQLRDMDSMGGLAQKMPFTGVASALAALSTAGIPPLPGFWSKLLIVIALWLAGFKVYAILAVVASVITLSYMLSLQRRVFFGNVGEHLLHIKEAGAELLIPSTILVLIMVGVGIFFPFIIGTFLLPVTRLW